MSVTHPVYGVRVEPALGPVAMSGVVSMVVRQGPQRRTHYRHYERAKQIS